MLFTIDLSTTISIVKFYLNKITLYIQLLDVLDEFNEKKRNLSKILFNVYTIYTLLLWLRTLSSVRW